MTLKIRSIPAAATAITFTAGVVATVGILTERYLISAIVGLIVIYLVTVFVVRRYVIYRIKPIYEIMKQRDASPGEIQKDYSGKDIVSEVRSELNEWTSESNIEIAKLKENDVFRQNFVSNVLHELKTPIFCIQGYTLTLLDGGIEDPEINRRYVEMTEKNINRLINVVEDLDTISRLENEPIFLETERFDIVDLMYEVSALLEMRAQEKHISISIDVRPGTEIYVIAERKRIFQVLTNLMTNAIKYGNERGHTTIRFVDMFERIMVEVQDDGIGMTPQELSHMFERFYRVDKNRSRSEGSGGTGLGLAITRHIIEAHRQTITVRSTKDVGTTFAFTLQKA